MVVVDRLRHGRVPKLKEVHLIVVECIVLAMCSDQVYGGMVDLSYDMLGCVQSVPNLRLVESSVFHLTRSVRC